MATIVQYDFLEDRTISELRSEIEEIRLSTEKVRKSLFAKNGDMVKMLLDLLHRVEQLEGKKNASM